MSRVGIAQTNCPNTFSLKSLPSKLSFDRVVILSPCPILFYSDRFANKPRCIGIEQEIFVSKSAWCLLSSDTSRQEARSRLWIIFFPHSPFFFFFLFLSFFFKKKFIAVIKWNKMLWKHIHSNEASNAGLVRWRKRNILMFQCCYTREENVTTWSQSWPISVCCD